MKWQPVRTQGDVHVCPSMQTQGVTPGYIYVMAFQAVGI